MKILCIGDSLGMPRLGVSYEDTWFYKLTQEYKNCSFINKFRRTMTTDALRDSDYYFSYYFPDVVIVQLGICDCSPRIINERNPFWKALVLISKKLKFENVFWRTIKLFYSRNNSKRVWVSIDRFKANVIDFAERMIVENSSIKIIFVSIATPSKILQEKTPYMMSNVAKYNEVYYDVSTKLGGVYCVNPLDSSDDGFYVEDGYHPNSLGHDKIFHSLEFILNSWVNK